MSNNAGAIRRAALAGKSRTHQFFKSPLPRGRKITAGFSFLQRIGKGAGIDVWFPEELQRKLEALTQAGIQPVPHHFPAEWAAIRQFELLQEAGNYKIYDMDLMNLTRTLVDQSRSMRGGGYRVTIASLGSYTHEDVDDLEILDLQLQNKLQNLIHMLYLDQQSEMAQRENTQKLASTPHASNAFFPHIGATLGARDLFRPFKSEASHAAARKHKLACQFLDILDQLPQNHIIHDTALALQLPESIAENEWLYLADEDKTFAAFNRFLGSFFGEATKHLRAYGDRLTTESASFYRSLIQLAC